MLAHHDAVEQLARRAEGVRLRPALKTLLETVRARSQAERLALQARLDRAALIVFAGAQTLLIYPQKKPTPCRWAKAGT